MNEEQLKEVQKICKQNDITYLGLFGSFARGEEKPESDVDLLVEYSPTSSVKSLFDHVGIQRQFAEMLNKHVDLVTRRSLHPYIKDYVYKDLKILYEKR